MYISVSLDISPPPMSTIYDGFSGPSFHSFTQEWLPNWGVGTLWSTYAMAGFIVVVPSASKNELEKIKEEHRMIVTTLESCSLLVKRVGQEFNTHYKDESTMCNDGIRVFGKGK